MKQYTFSELKELSKSKLGTLGENIVIEKLQERGLRVVNANTLHNNYKSIDLICTNPINNQTVEIQVKTSFGTNIPIGTTLANCIKDKLEKKILGPWVFIHIETDGSMHFYILTREEMILLAHESNDWYMNKWKSSYRKKPVNPKNACGLYIKWIDGEGDEENYKHYAFINPLRRGGAENHWEKILQAVNKDSIYKTLSDFTGVTDITDEYLKFSKLSEMFSIIAKRVFFGGYFQINDARRIYPEELEFYYHEEANDGLKDPVMYHTEDHEKKSLPYFPLGAFNFHVSGLDVTFENKEKQYRASFLIRGYKVCEYDGKEWKETKSLENRSTYIYEDMLMNIPIFCGINIRWIDEHLQPRSTNPLHQCIPGFLHLWQSL